MDQRLDLRRRGLVRTLAGWSPVILAHIAFGTLRVAPEHELTTHPDFIQRLLGMGVGFVPDDAFCGGCLAIHRGLGE